jgi:hypothetical protein
MVRTIEAVVNQDGSLRLLEPVTLTQSMRVFVTLHDEASPDHEATLLSEASLATDWNRPEEDAAWAYLQSGK